MGVQNVKFQDVQRIRSNNQSSDISQVQAKIHINEPKLVNQKSLSEHIIIVAAAQESAKNTISDILTQNINIFQSNISLAQCRQMINMIYTANQKICIAIMNTWSPEQMEDFIDKYTTLPEAMLGKLFSMGLSSDIIPNDIKQAKLFLHVAVVNDPERLINEILSKFDIQTNRLCISQLDKNDITTLSQHKLPLMYLPIEALTSVSILQIKSDEHLQQMFSHMITSRQVSIAG